MLKFFRCMVILFLYANLAKLNCVQTNNDIPKIYVVIHICTIANWRDILEEQLERIKTSGLYEACDGILMGVVGTESVNYLKRKYPKVIMFFQYQDVKLYERPTLLSLYDLCKHNQQAFVLYLHTKGVSKSDNNLTHCIRDWRRYMEYFSIDQWRICVDVLKKEGVDVCGVNWVEIPSPHFSGNFWWAKARYIVTLPRYIGEDYFAPEMWLGLNNPNYHSFHQSGISHYEQLYPEDIYIQKISYKR